MKLRFFPARPTEDRTVLILTVRKGAGGGLRPVRLGTGINVEMKYWDSTKDRLKKSSNDAVFVNAQLDEIEQETKRLLDTAIRIVKTDPLEYLKKELPKFDILAAHRSKKNVEDEGLIISGFRKYLQYVKETRADATHIRVTTIFNHVKDFISLNPHYSRFTSITPQFEADFLKYLYDKKMTDNTASRTLTGFKTMLNWCQERGITTVAIGKLFAATQMSKEASTIALTKEELQEIEKLELEAKMDRVKDTFLMLCYTGLRYSDYMQLQPHHRQGKYILLTSMKTKQKLRIPVTAKIEAIWSKYNGELPKISSQKFNDYVKELCKKIEMVEPFEQVRHRGKERVVDVQPKHNFISSHTGRRTFITLSLQAGMTPDEISGITGHTDYRSFKKYIRHSTDYIFDKTEKAWE